MATPPKTYSAKIGTGSRALTREVTLEPAAQKTPDDAAERVTEEPDNNGGRRRWTLTVDGEAHAVDAHRLPTGGWSLLIGDVSWVIDVDTAKNGALLVSAGGASVPVSLVDPRREMLGKHVLRKQDSGPNVMRSQMPGKIIKVVAKVGDKVSAGQGLLLVEAMKMENELVAARDGVVLEIHVKVGQAVEAQEALVTLQ